MRNVSGHRLAALEALARVADRIAAADLPEEVVDGLAPPQEEARGRAAGGSGRSHAGWWGALSLPQRRQCLRRGSGSTSWAWG